MSLHNGGGFVARIMFEYMKEDGTKATTGHGPDITLGRTEAKSPADFNIPDGAIVWLRADVVAGKDNTANQGFVFRVGNPLTANYTITGTTLSNTLGLINVS